MQMTDHFVPALDDDADALAALRDIDPTSEAAQAVLIEVLAQMLERLDADPMDQGVYDFVLTLDAGLAATAAHLLQLANFPDGAGSAEDLDDGTLLLLAALAAAAGDRDAATGLLGKAEVTRPSPRFWPAAFELRCRIIDDCDAIVDAMILKVTHPLLDCPELWAVLPRMTARHPGLVDAFDARIKVELVFKPNAQILREVCLAASGQVEEALRRFEPLMTQYSLVTLAEGAMFQIKAWADPQNPVYDLTDRFCTTPFETLDVLEDGSHLCCASWLGESVGNLQDTPWGEVWNSATAQNVRASVFDGSYRHCAKIACPRFATGAFKSKQQVAELSDAWRDVIENRRVEMPAGPQTVNLAYDQTCNLSCPSCRPGKIAADAATRARYDTMQDEQILPMLRDTKLVHITGSGDPFASKNFRALIEKLGPEDYPELRFQIMTNGMLFTRREWDRFPALHGRVAFLRISLDAATGPTHELLRRGARWPVMEQNLAFAGELRAAGLIDRLDLSFVVQTDNFREMGDAVDLARDLGADSMAFSRLTNWGTFTPEQYAAKAVFMPSHPEHDAFIAAMQDPRLRDRPAWLGELDQFIAA